MYVCIAETSRAAPAPRLTSMAGCSSPVSFHMLCDSWYRVPWSAAPVPRGRRSFSSRSYCPFPEAIPTLWAQGPAFCWWKHHAQYRPSWGSCSSWQVFTFSWREDIRPGDPQHTKKFCFDAISHSSPVTLYDCHGMKGNQLWRYRKVSLCVWVYAHLRCQIAWGAYVSWKCHHSCFIPSLHVAAIRESADSLLSLYHWLKRADSPVALVRKVRTPGLLSRGHSLCSVPTAEVMQRPCVCKEVFWELVCSEPWNVLPKVDKDLFILLLSNAIVGHR